MRYRYHCGAVAYDRSLEDMWRRIADAVAAVERSQKVATGLSSSTEPFPALCSSDSNADIRSPGLAPPCARSRVRGFR